MTTTVPASIRPAPARASFRLFRAQVLATRRLGQHHVRVTFGGADLQGMTSGGLDQRVKLLIPLPGQHAPCLPPDFEYRSVRSMPEHIRPKLRTYTLRAHRAASAEADIDFVLHGDTGPGAAFARRAQPGDQVCLYAPDAAYPHTARLTGVEYRMDQVRDRALIVGDETALPAIASITEALPADVHAKICIEAPWTADTCWAGETPEFATVANLDLTWVQRGPVPGAALLDALRSSELRGHGWYAWIAGEASLVRAARRHLVRERGLQRNAVTFMGYWRRGVTEDARAPGHR